MVETDTVLAFPYLLMQICIVVKVLETPDVDDFIQLRNTTDLGLIHDIANTISKQAKIEGTLLLRYFRLKGLVLRHWGSPTWVIPLLR